MTETEQPANGVWQHSKFSCCEDVPGCLCAAFCSPCYVYKTVEKTGESTGISLLTALFPVLLVCVRGYVREKSKIEGSLMGDCASVMCCGLCTVVQINREYDH